MEINKVEKKSLSGLFHTEMRQKGEGVSNMNSKARTPTFGQELQSTDQLYEIIKQVYLCFCVFVFLICELGPIIGTP